MARRKRKRNSKSNTSHYHNNTLVSKGSKGKLSRFKMQNKADKTVLENKISKLFQKLRDESLDSGQGANLSSSASISLNNTVIELDTSCNGNQNIVNTPPQSSKIPSIIIVSDEKTGRHIHEVKTPRRNLHTSPMHCSTPINKRESQCTLKNNNISSELNLNNEISNLTKEIAEDSYITIDLTTESREVSKPVTVIDLSDNAMDQSVKMVDMATNIESDDCQFVSISNTSLSMSGDSNVTVLNKSGKNKASMRKFASKIAKLNASEKGKLLEMITETIFSGCQMSNKKSSLLHLRDQVSQGTETAEDTYIREVILGQVTSRNSIGSNIYHPRTDVKNRTGLRMIVIDGSNVAMEHGKGKVFSVKGLKICIDYFLNRGHSVKAFVPRFRCKYSKSTIPKLLDQMERQGHVVYTPSREIQGKTITPYDDRYIVQCAAEFDGVIVSGDNYRDLLLENPRWRFVIENRLLPFTWVNDMIMFPRDPLGRNGPTLEQFLKHPVPSQAPTQK